MKIALPNNFKRERTYGGGDVPKFTQEGSFNAVCKIMNANYIEDFNKDNEPMNYIEMQFDIFEGPDAGIYERKFNYDTDNLEAGQKAGWKGKIRLYTPNGKDAKQIERFNRNLDYFEDENPDFEWTGDTNCFKGMLIGIKFRSKYYEFNDKSGYYPEPKFLCSAKRVREGKEGLLDVYIPDQYKKTAEKYVPMAEREKTKVEDVVEDDDDLPF